MGNQIEDWSPNCSLFASPMVKQDAIMKEIDKEISPIIHCVPPKKKTKTNPNQLRLTVFIDAVCNVHTRRLPTFLVLAWQTVEDSIGVMYTYKCCVSWSIVHTTRWCKWIQTFCVLKSQFKCFNYCLQALVCFRFLDKQFVKRLPIFQGDQTYI